MHGVQAAMRSSAETSVQPELAPRASPHFHQLALRISVLLQDVDSRLRWALDLSAHFPDAMGVGAVDFHLYSMIMIVAVSMLFSHWDTPK